MNDTAAAERIRGGVAEMVGLPVKEVTDDLKLLSGGPLRNPYPLPHALFHNDGSGFDDVTWVGGVADVGHGKGSALVDVDRDGWMEFVVANYGQELRTYRNQVGDQGNDNHWITIELRGTTDNRDALGTIVGLDTAEPSALTQTCFMTQRPSNSAGGERTCHFGLGDNDSIEAIRIHWPNGRPQTPKVPAVDERVLFIQD